MGQRTQLLVTVKYGEEIKTSFSIHYQWGYGRVMLMDTLNILWFLSLYGDYRLRELEPEVYTERIMEKSNGVRNFEPDEDYSSWGIVAYKETLENVFDRSDNNDGYIHLQMNFGEEPFKVTSYDIDYYDHLERKVDFYRYCYESDEYAYTNEEFRDGFQTLLESLEER